MTQQAYTFKKESRLLTPFCFSRVFEDATPAVSPQITLLARKNNLPHARLGITIPKKRVKLAVQRNRIKRCARESFRLKAQELPNIDVIMIGKSGVDALDNSAIAALLNQQWKKLIKRCAQK